MSAHAANAIRRRFRAGVAAFGVGLFLLGLVPKIPQLESMDRRLLSFLLKTSGAQEGKVRIVGTGDFDDPRAMRGMPTAVSDAQAAVPQFLAFGDDPEQIFQSSPPSPTDLAVVLDDLYEIGHRKLAVATPMAWENPGEVEAAVLNHELGRFAPAIVGVPLVRGLTAVPLLPAFERASVPVERVEGGVRRLPIVNQLAVPNPQFGGESTWAAFTRLENEEDPEFSEGAVPVRVPMLARWGDRVVLALPLAVTMARFDVKAEDLRIAPGRNIRLGEFGPVIPIDEFGRVRVVSGVAKRVVVVPAEETVRPPGEAAPASLKPGKLPIILRDERKEAPPAEKSYSLHLADVFVALDHAPRSNLLQPLPRPHVAVEILIMGVFAGLSAWFCCLRAGFRHGLFLLLALGALGLSWALLAVWHVASPPLALLAAPLAGWGMCLVWPKGNPRADGD
jgi:hypothetical protein